MLHPGKETNRPGPKQLPVRFPVGKKAQKEYGIPFFKKKPSSYLSNKHKLVRDEPMLDDDVNALRSKK